MNSWEIIKSELTKRTTPRTMGRSIAMIQCAELFVRIMPNLIDSEAATASMNGDNECRDGLMARGQVESLRAAGVL